MVARWPHGAECVLNLAKGHRIERGQPSAQRGADRIERSRRDESVLVDLADPLGEACLRERGQVAGSVDEIGQRQVTRRRVAAKQSGEMGRGEDFLDGADAIGSLGVSRRRPVGIEIQLADEERGHAVIP